MKRNLYIQVRVNKFEQNVIQALANKRRRTVSDTIRIVLLDAAEDDGVLIQEVKTKQSK